jgi:hypothetical protein
MFHRSRRRCGTCRHFEPGPLRGQGCCQHPKVNGNGQALRLMPARELGCAQRMPVLWEAAREEAVDG